MSDKNSKKDKANLPILIFMLLLLAGVASMYYRPALDRHLEIRFLSLSLLLFGTAVYGILAARKLHRKINPQLVRNPISYAFGLYVVISGLSVFWATDASEARAVFLKTALLFLLFIYLSLNIVSRKNSRREFLRALIIFASINSLAGVFQSVEVFGKHGFSLDTAYMVTGNSAHKNIYSQVLLLSFPFLIFSVYKFKNFFRKLALINAVIHLLFILILMTRSVWLASAVSGLFSAFVFLIKIKPDLFKKLKSDRKLLAVVSVSGLLIIGGGVVFFTQSNTASKQITEATNFKTGNTAHRIKLWKSTGKLVKEHPITGVGVGNWKTEIMQHDVVMFYNDKWKVPRRAHNSYLTVFAETGLFGFIAYFAVGIVAFIFLLRSLSQQSKLEDKYFLLSLLFSFVSFAVFSFFSYSSERAEIMILLVIILAFAAYYKHSGKQQNQDATIKITLFRMSALLVLGISFFSAMSSYTRLMAEKKMGIILNLPDTPKADKYAHSLLEDTDSPFVKSSPMSDPFSSLRSVYLFKQKAGIDKIAAGYKKSLEISPYHIRTLLELAYAFYTVEEYDSCLKYSEMAYKYAPSNAHIVINHGAFLYKNDEKAKAFEVVKNIHPYVKRKAYRNLMYKLLVWKIMKMYEKEEDPMLKLYLLKYSENKERVMNIYLQAYTDENIGFDSLYYELAREELEKINSAEKQKLPENPTDSASLPSEKN